MKELSTSFIHLLVMRGVENVEKKKEGRIMKVVESVCFTITQ
jgi:hypothetical protein